MHAEPPVAFLESMLIGGGPVNAVVISLGAKAPIVEGTLICTDLH